MTAKTYRGIANLQEAISWAKGKPVPTSIFSQMPLDWEVCEYGYGDGWGDISEKERETWVKDVCPWYTGSRGNVHGILAKGLNTTTDFENAKGYAEDGYILGINPTGDTAEFSSTHLYLKDARDTELVFIYSVKENKYYLPQEFLKRYDKKKLSYRENTLMIKLSLRDKFSEANIKEIASKLEFKETTKLPKEYKFVSDISDLIPFSYTVAKEPVKIDTITSDGKETTNEAKKDDVIISGPSDERYVLKENKFSQKYEGKIGETVIPEQSKRQVAVYTGKESVSFKAPWGEEMILKPNDYLVKDGNDYYRIAKKEFEQTYKPI